MAQCTEGVALTAAHRAKYLTSAGVHARQMPTIVERGLLNLYFLFVNSMLPLVNRESFMAAHAKGNVSGLLTKAICLVALGLEPAAAVLKFGFHGRVDIPQRCSRKGCSGRTASSWEGQAGELTCDSLAAALYDAITAALGVNYHDGDDIEKIQVLALMSLRVPIPRDHTEETWSLCQAVTVAQTIGLHARHNQGPFATQRSRESIEGSDLWWSLYVLDRLGTMSEEHKANMICDRDIGTRKPEPHDATAAGLSHRVLCEWLDFVCLWHREGHMPIETTSPSCCVSKPHEVAGAGGNNSCASTHALGHLIRHLLKATSDRPPRGGEAEKPTPINEPGHRLAAIHTFLRYISDHRCVVKSPHHVSDHAIAVAFCALYRLYQAHIPQITTGTSEVFRISEFYLVSLAGTLRRLACWYLGAQILDRLITKLLLIDAVQDSSVFAAAEVEQLNSAHESADPLHHMLKDLAEESRRLALPRVSKKLKTLLLSKPEERTRVVGCECSGSLM